MNNGWNYRVVKEPLPDGEYQFTIHEVYYGPNEEVESYTEKSIAPYGETLQELIHDLAHMKEAFSRSILIKVDDKLVEEENVKDKE